MSDLPDVATLNAEVSRAVGRYAAGLSRETVTGSAPGVAVRTDLNGTVLEVALAEDAPYNWSMPRLGELVVEAIGAANRAAATRREQLASDIDLFEEPVVAMTDEMATDPAASLEWLSEPRYW